MAKKLHELLIGKTKQEKANLKVVELVKLLKKGKFKKNV